MPKASDADKASDNKALAIQIIGAWRDRMLLRWTSAKEWAVSAHLDPTVITRNMQADTTKGTVKIENLHALARASQVPSVLDFLAGQDVAIHERGPWVPKAATMQRLLAFVVRSSPASQIREADIQWFARGLVAGLELLAADPSKEDSEDYLAAVEHQIARSLRESTPKPSQAA